MTSLQNNTVPSSELSTAADLLQQWIGLDPSTVGLAAIDRAVRLRMEAIGQTSQSDFAVLVRSDTMERDRLVEEIVVAESWFFRDIQVFDFVRRFAITLASMPHRTPVRILCVPCAAGEEPYSVAMDLLDAGLSADQFTIDAIDVSHRALERAAQARYSANAFRNADLAFRDRWFRSESGVCVLDEKVRACVRFAWGNLLDKAFRTHQPSYDIIFCRNLLIYLTSQARVRIEQTLDTLLVPDGLLILGAAEPAILKGEWLPAGAASVFAIRRGVRVVDKAISHRKSVYKNIAQPSGRPRTPSAPPAVKNADSSQPNIQVSTQTLEDVLHEAGVLANGHRYTDAFALCHTHEKNNGPSPELFFLMGILHQSAGDLDRAEGCFHKTLYLDGFHEEALLSLALLASQRGDTSMAEKYRLSAARAFARKASS